MSSLIFCINYSILYHYKSTTLKGLGYRTYDNRYVIYFMLKNILERLNQAIDVIDHPKKASKATDVDTLFRQTL